jgi:hypothetical protein
MTIPSWKDNGNAWDSLILGGLTIPGVAKVSGKVAEKIDVQVVKGTKGAKTVDEGPEPASLTIEIEQTKDEASEFEKILDTLHPRKNDQHAGPLEIIHPSANLLGITSIKIKSISLPQLDSDLIKWTIEAIEHFQEPKKAKAKTKPAAKKTKAENSDYMPKYEAGSYDGTYTPPSQEGLSNLDSLMNQYPNSPASTESNYPY